MAKHVAMTRERKIALPIILSAAREHLRAFSGNGKREQQLKQALEAFHDVG